MGPDRSLQPIRTGISRALSADYFAKREMPARIKELLAQLRVKEAGPAGASRADPVVQSTGRRPADVVRDGQRRSRLTDAAVRYELIRYLHVLGDYLPDWLCRGVKWLRKPERFFARLLVSFALIAGGALFFARARSLDATAWAYHHLAGPGVPAAPPGSLVPLD